MYAVFHATKLNGNGKVKQKEEAEKKFPWSENWNAILGSLINIHVHQKILFPPL